ncbi:LysM peptidoglycan-binding domain-containing protein [Flavihumibacter petaseus]|uniref:LysM domain-containing protein n=1 Tax=Flavihumibacter petaseus NBRC 106054 TaxID=1220578 RepID=A0A0E9MZ07_9BACT|nr:LysM domain-containing protein [Flavihumibacter petaseus]GAO42947.1 hypothetical protein FPE01S_02_00520 [Flavihumibacter petaseus NBRC 106054]
MLKRPILSIVFVILTCVVRAQGTLQVQGITPDLYLLHKVQPKETWYSIGRTYNLPPKEIGTYNKTDINSGLSVGQTVKIPLVGGNFVQTTAKANDEALVPVYHTVKEGEWMYRVSTNHNKVPVDQLESWNNIKSNQVKSGMNLIVGYLKVKKDQSALASGNIPVAPVSAPAATSAVPAASSVSTGAASTGASGVVTTGNSKPAQPSPVATNPAPAPATSNLPASLDYRGGYFKSQYETGSSKSAKGTAATFRSTSGWNDGKYYALMDEVPVGTIVMVTNTASGKVIYAKVLGNLSDIRENAGLAIRISNAAATELGAGENKFSAEVRF